MQFGPRSVCVTLEHAIPAHRIRQGLAPWLSNMLWSQTLNAPTERLSVPLSGTSGTDTPGPAELPNPTAIASIPVTPSACLSAIDRLLSIFPDLPGNIIDGQVSKLNCGALAALRSNVAVWRAPRR